MVKSLNKDQKSKSLREIAWGLVYGKKQSSEDKPQKPGELKKQGSWAYRNTFGRFSSSKKSKSTKPTNNDSENRDKLFDDLSDNDNFINEDQNNDLGPSPDDSDSEEETKKNEVEPPIFIGDPTSLLPPSEYSVTPSVSEYDPDDDYNPGNDYGSDYDKQEPSKPSIKPAITKKKKDKPKIHNLYDEDSSEGSEIESEDEYSFNPASSSSNPFDTDSDIDSDIDSTIASEEDDDDETFFCVDDLQKNSNAASPEKNSPKKSNHTKQHKYPVPQDNDYSDYDSNSEFSYESIHIEEIEPKNTKKGKDVKIMKNKSITKPTMTKEDAAIVIGRFLLAQAGTMLFGQAGPLLFKQVGFKKDLKKKLVAKLTETIGNLSQQLSAKNQEKLANIQEKILTKVEDLAIQASQEKIDEFSAWCDELLEEHKDDFPDTWHTIKATLVQCLNWIIDQVRDVVRMMKREKAPTPEEKASRTGFFAPPKSNGFVAFENEMADIKAHANEEVAATRAAVSSLGLSS